MGTVRPLVRLALLSLLSPAVTAAVPLVAQETPARLAGTVDEGARAALPAALLPRRAGDLGPVDDALPTGRLLLLLARSPRQQAELDEYLEAAHTPGNPLFRHWLTPAEFGRRFGPAGSDLAALKAWLEAHGLTVSRVTQGRTAIEFSGTAGQLREAFHTEVHRYDSGGRSLLAAAGQPSVPAALAPLVAGVLPLSNRQPEPQIRLLGSVRMNPATHAATAEWTYPNGGAVSYVLAPGDFATQYDLGPVYQAGITGKGQSIAIVSASNVDLNLVQAYQKLFGLSASLPQVVVDGEDPGENSAATEAYLDLELASAVAPGARIVLYTSDGTALASGLALAALRAVEDDLAGTISVSYGECEAFLGASGNGFWAALWQQAAAQGQTVFVASGDSGSAGCDNFAVQEQAYSGLAVNGLASTPWNVAVGGADFYYSQAAGSQGQVNSQLAAYWTSATASPTVSLKQRVPEQAWNDFFGLNLTDGADPLNNAAESILASGGGLSGAAMQTGSGKATGYPKPAWQAGLGVPADKVRDLPDLALFAANGANLSFYPICAQPGDCTASNVNASGAVQVTGVGGTSAAAPAMAAIQALVNQSAGSWAGQADAVYYPLATRQPSVFHSIATGGNQVLCAAGTANCVQSGTGVTSGYWVLSGYSAGAGYDLATGLGSVDVANLIKYWNSVTLTQTATTFSVSPAALVHGKTAILKGTVAPAKGSGTPAGSIALTALTGLPHETGLGSYPLVNGSFYAQVDNLPGGAYQLTASYSGDASFAPGKSAPVTVTVTPETPTLATSGWVWNPSDLNLYALTVGMTVPYGTRIFLDAQPVSRNATLAGELTAASGTVTFTDKLGTATATSTQPLNAAGVAEWASGVFAPGTHTVTAAYSGDASYQPATAPAVSFTVIRGATTLTVRPLASPVAAGSSVSVDVQLAAGYLPLWGSLPAGSVTVTLGNATATVPLSAFGPKGNATLEGVAVFSKVPAGLLPVSAFWAGNANWMGATASGGTVLALSTKMTPSVSLTTSAAAPSLGQSFTLTAQVTGPAGSPAPSGSVLMAAEAGAWVATVPLSKGTAKLEVSAADLPNGTSVFTAVYQGDANYTTSASGPVGVTVAQQDFSFTAPSPTLRLAPGKSARIDLMLAPLNGFGGTLAISAAAPSGVTVTVWNPTLPLTCSGTTAATITAAATAASGVYPVNFVASGGGHTHSAQVLVVVPGAGH
ncbi:MAG: Ig-like domain repeat protein [Terracidiphilus sp.]